MRHPDDKPYVQFGPPLRERPDWADRVTAKPGTPDEQARGILDAVTSMAYEPRAAINEFSRELDGVGDLLAESERYVTAIVNRHAIACNSIARSIAELRATIGVAASMLRQVLDESKGNGQPQVHPAAEDTSVPEENPTDEQILSAIRSGMPGQDGVNRGLHDPV